MPGSRTLRAALAIAALLLPRYALSFAFDDGFGASVRSQSHHFSVYISEGVSPEFLSQQLNIRPSDKLLAGRPLKENPPKDTLAESLDILYAQVSDMLDMRLYEYKLNLKVCRDSRQMNGIYRGLYGKDLNTSSFYSQDTNTIYLSADNFKRNILGHELAHAIIAHYFVVPPPAKIHEILSMYVEYQLRRYAEHP